MFQTSGEIDDLYDLRSHYTTTDRDPDLTGRAVSFLICTIYLTLAGWEPYHVHDLNRACFLGLDLRETGPAQRLIEAEARVQMI